MPGPTPRSLKLHCTARAAVRGRPALEGFLSPAIPSAPPGLPLPPAAATYRVTAIRDGRIFVEPHRGPAPAGPKPLALAVFGDNLAIPTPGDPGGGPPPLGDFSLTGPSRTGYLVLPTSPPGDEDHSRPFRSSAVASPAARVVLPTPPFPVTNTTRARGGREGSGD